jgi:nitrogen fixation protein NifU and related proteins
MSTVTALSGDELRELYRDLILDHARHPRHFGPMDAPTHEATGLNPLCGDRLHLYLDVDADDILRDVRFQGSGCAISMASASLLTESVIGLERDAALARHAVVTAALRGDTPAVEELGKLQALLGVRDFPSRVKCATLAWHALRSALTENKPTVSTEGSD